MILLRILIDVLLLFAVFLLPWWLLIPISVALSLYFNFYLEAVFAGFIFDILYAPESFFIGAYIITIVMIIFFISIEILKKKLDITF